MLKKILLGFFLFIILASFSLILAPFDHIRNFISWGPHSIYDWKTHPSESIAASSHPEPWMKDSTYNTGVFKDSLMKVMEAKKTMAYIIIQDGKIKYEKYWDGYNEKTISGSFSAAKSVISMLIGIAQQEGKIKSLDQKVAEFLPEFLEDGKEKTTIKDLLTMSSGTNWKESDKSYFSLNAQSYYADDLDYPVSQFKQKEPAGKTWEYRSGDTQALGLILEKVFNSSIAKLTQKYFYEPMGFETEAKWLLDGDKKHAKSFCCLNTTARDYARFGQLMLGEGVWKDKQVVPKDYMKAALSPASYLLDPTENNIPVDYYGYQFWIFNHKGMKIPCMNGLWGQYVFAIKEKNAIVVRLGISDVEKFEHHYQPDMKAYVDAAMEVLK